LGPISYLYDRLYPLLICAALMTGWGRASAQNFSPYSKSYALVIGVDHYPNFPDDVQLTGAVRDAEAIATVLRIRGFEVISLLNQDATRANIFNAINRTLKDKVREDDRVLIYFAGHGIAEVGASGEPIGYLLPEGTMKDNPQLEGIEMEWITKNLRQYRSKHVMYIPDACYSGIAARRVSTRGIGTPDPSPVPDIEYLKSMTAERVLVTISGGSSTEEVLEHEGQGLFTGRFLHGLKGDADYDKNGWITSRELMAYVEMEVPRIAQEQHHRNQHPQMVSEGDGLYLFRNLKAPAQAHGE
jgi:uncharacterized caspase-like protein